MTSPSPYRRKVAEAISEMLEIDCPADEKSRELTDVIIDSYVRILLQSACVGFAVGLTCGLLICLV